MRGLRPFNRQIIGTVIDIHRNSIRIELHTKALGVVALLSMIRDIASR